MRHALILCLWLGALAASPASASHSLFWAGETDPGATEESLIQSMRRTGAGALPLEALACYREGLHSFADGNPDRARELWNRAALLDPAFPEAHLALARAELWHRPQAALGHLAAAGRATLRSFSGQHLALVNLLLGGALLLVLASVLVVLYALAHIAARVHHVLGELLTRILPSPVATTAAALLLISPVLWRLGVIPAAVLFGGLMWPWMRRGERAAVAVLGGATAGLPLVLWLTSPVLLGPLDPQSPPALVSRAMAAPYSPELEAALRQAVEARPNSPELQFALATIAKRGGRFAEARTAYEQALAAGGPAAAIHNNLGVIAFLAGKFDRAVYHLREAVSRDPNLAAAHFNLSQAYAKKLYFDKADEELAEANRLAFTRIRAMIKNQTGGTNDTLLDEPLSAAAAWRLALELPRRLPGIPPWMRFLFPGSLVLLPALCLPLLGVGFLSGRWLHRTLPGFACTNCGRPVCRRCLRRIRRSPYCTRCGDALLQIQSAAYSQLALASRLRRTSRLGSTLGRAVRIALPGYHAAAIGRTGTAGLLAGLFVTAILTLAGGSFPVDRVVWLETETRLWWPGLGVFLLAVSLAATWLLTWRQAPAETAGNEDQAEEPLGPIVENARTTRKPSSANVQAA